MARRPHLSYGRSRRRARKAAVATTVARIANAKQEHDVPPVTRTELADHIQAAFTTEPATRADLLAAAVASNARPQAIQLLHQLPNWTYASIRELWYDLPGVPVNT
jgi:hypothetical protein